MKQITTGTKITFKETGDKFSITQTDTGFDLRQVKLSKIVPHEPYSFQEFLDLYEKNEIDIEGFEATDAGLVRSIITNYIYNTTLKIQLTEMETFKTRICELLSDNELLKKSNEELTNKNKELITQNNQLNLALEAMKEEEV